MTDVFDPATRSRVMARVKGKDTGPEMKVRKALTRLGARYRLHRKDLTLAVDAAKELNLSLPNAAATQQLMNSAVARGDGDNDHSALVRTLEALAGRDD